MPLTRKGGHESLSVNVCPIIGVCVFGVYVCVFGVCVCVCCVYCIVTDKDLLLGYSSSFLTDKDLLLGYSSSFSPRKAATTES